MRIYLTHCSKEKEPNLKGTDIAVTPDKLYTNPHIQQFMERCREQKVSWGILSDLYGVYLSDESHVWYEKHPDAVTPQEEENLIKDFDKKLRSFGEIFFYVRPESFHPYLQEGLREDGACWQSAASSKHRMDRISSGVVSQTSADFVEENVEG